MITGSIGGATGFGELKESDVRAFRRALPLQNLFYLSWLFTQLEHGMVSATGATPAPRRN
jgi:hypothetical protein